MPLPSRSQYASGEEFLCALNAHMELERSVYQDLRSMFDSTPEYSTLPEWVEKVAIKHVSLDSRPEDDLLEVALRNLSGYVLHHNQKVVRIAHGPIDGHWAVFAEVENS